MDDILTAMRKLGDAFNLAGARIRGAPIIEVPEVKPGEVIVSKDPLSIFIYKPGQYERMVRLGVREAHPWFKDPLDPLKLVR